MHTENTHKEQDLECRHCHCKFLTKNALDSHVNVIHFKKRAQKCIHCDFRTYISENLANHMIQMHQSGQQVSIFFVYLNIQKINLVLKKNQIEIKSESDSEMNVTDELVINKSFLNIFSFLLSLIFFICSLLIYVFTVG